MGDNGTKLRKDSRAAANLLRMANFHLRDAELLSSGNRPHNAPLLLQRAIDCLVEAVLVSEFGWPLQRGKSDVRAIPDVNPLKLSLARAAKSAPDSMAPSLLPDAELPLDLDRDALRRDAASVRQLLRELTEHFGVDLSSNEPATEARPIRLPPPPDNEDHARRLAPKPGPSLKTSAKLPGKNDQTPKTARAPAATRDEKVPVPIKNAPSARPTTADSPPNRSMTSTAFWSLMDRWSCDDLSALQLLNYRDGLTKKGTRPRFKLVGEQATMAKSLQDLDQALSSIHVDPAMWLNKPIRDEPFAGATAIEYLKRTQLSGVKTLSRFILKNGLKLSIINTR